MHLQSLAGWHDVWRDKGTAGGVCVWGGAMEAVTDSRS
jgi:hypothetical protein